MLYDNKIQVHPDSKVHGANMGPTCVLSAPDGPHGGPMNLAIRAFLPIEQIGISQITIPVAFTGTVHSPVDKQ